MLKLVAAAMAVLASGAGGGGNTAPIYLVTQPVEGGVTIQVIGASTSDYQATFLLNVTSPSGQSQHRGSATIRAGERVTLSTVTVGVPANGKWRARLTVEPSSAEPYEQVAEAPQS